ncbi:MAG: hypothetical protein KJ714_07965 [Euryarchaeota archaeon]|nr:hypothetical protein [Euryarchaeota archaeon]
MRRHPSNISRQSSSNRCSTNRQRRWGATPDPNGCAARGGGEHIVSSRCNNSCPEGCAGKCASLWRQE